MKVFIIFAIVVLGFGLSEAQDKPALEQAREKFQAADALLSKTLKETSAELDKEKAAALQTKEQTWLKFREARSESSSLSNTAAKGGSPKLSVDYWDAMSGYTQERIDFLHAYSGKNVPKGVTGEYKDAYDGDLELEETKDGINFSFSVVRGNAAHTGQITGTALRKGDKAYFKEKLEAGQKGPACELVFTFVDGHIVRVEEKSPDPDAESGVHYDGDYFKTVNSGNHV